MTKEYDRAQDYLREALPRIPDASRADTDIGGHEYHPTPDHIRLVQQARTTTGTRQA